MRLSKFSDKYKNNSFLLYVNTSLILAILPILFFKLSGYFSGFGFIIVNSNFILISQQLNIINLIIGLSIPLNIILFSLVCGLDRKLISSFFPIIVNYTIYGLIIYLLFVIFSYSFIIFLFLNEIAGLRLIFIVLGLVLSLSLLYVFPPILKGIFNFSKIPYIPVIGVVLNEVDHKELFSLVEKISNSINAKKPKNIVVSISNNFYAISKDIIVFNGVNEFKLKNETLHISLPYLRVLTQNELEGVIGHELGHFEGEDTSYAIKFAPIYRRLNQQLIELENFYEDEDNKKSYLIKLAVYPIIFLFNEFTRKEEKISREQEIKADNYGSKTSGGAKAFITALAKVYIYGLIWSETEENFREMVRVKKNEVLKNLSLKFHENAKSLLDKDKLIQYLEGIKNFEQYHPSDTHPILEDRMNNLGISINDISNNDLTNFEPSASKLLPKINIIEENLTLVLRELEK
jgi:Zn-dependent protease with chaperone function